MSVYISRTKYECSRVRKLATEIVSDNASYFLSELIKSFGDFTGVLHTTIQPYSHEENGIVERANQEVTRHLTVIVTDKDIRKN